MSLSDLIRQELLRNPHRTARDVARATGVSESSLSRFLQRGNGLSMKAINALVHYLGLIPGTSRGKQKV